MEITSIGTICAVVLALIIIMRVRSRRSRFVTVLDILPGPTPSSWLLGCVLELVNRQSWRFYDNVAETYGPTSQITGLFGGRFLHTSDPRALHAILIKDIENFPKRLVPSDEFSLLLGPGLLAELGSAHRRQRKMLNPVFSVAHLRNMTGIFYTIAHQVQQAIESRIGKERAEIDMNGWMARTTLEMLGQAGLGYSFDDFSGDATDDYGESLKMFFPVMGSLPLMELTTHHLSRFLSERAIRKLYRFYPSKNMQRMLDIAELMDRRSREIIDEKRAALEKGDQELVHRIGEGKDIMSILLKANVAASESEKLSDEEIVAQMSTFILAGMDTTSNGLSRTLQVLAEHPEAQEKLRAEIIEAQGGRAHPTDIEHDELVKLPYLDAVCRETLRVYAPVPLIARPAAKDTVLPLLAPVRAKDGSQMSEIALSKGTPILMNIQATNCNKALWGEDANEWRPERWLQPLPSELEDARIPGVYSNLMSFSGGTRSCIGFKFSQLEMKVVLAVLLSSFKFELTEKPIAWNSAAVLYPTMGEESTKPEMLLNVTVV